MKIKCQPDDFYVEEIINIPFNKTGAYSIYKLEKKYWDTFDLLDYLSRKYKFKNVGRAGIKDRYSHSVQYISIKDIKQLQITEENFTLSLIGKSAEPITVNRLVGNFFRIIIRDLNQKEADYIKQNQARVKEYGFPNYYDEQRMGSARAKQGFIAQKLVGKHYNGALKLYLATPSRFDDSRTRRVKKYLNDHWGDWKTCLDRAHNLGQHRYPLQYLVQHPKDFKGAIKTIRRDLLEMFINAYQAYLWNETLKKVIAMRKINYFANKYRFGELYFYDTLSKENFHYLKDLVIPAPSYKSKFAQPEIKTAMEQVLAEDSETTNQNITLNKLKIDLDIRGLFFKPFERKAIAIPENLQIEKPMTDDLYPKKLKMTVSFALSKGSYATIVIKRITSI